MLGVVSMVGCGRKAWRRDLRTVLLSSFFVWMGIIQLLTLISVGGQRIFSILDDKRKVEC